MIFAPHVYLAEFDVEGNRLRLQQIASRLVRLSVRQTAFKELPTRDNIAEIQALAAEARRAAALEILHAATNARNPELVDARLYPKDFLDAVEKELGRDGYKVFTPLFSGYGD